jgi:benzoyl-CoA reductase/2-hydroxyglutaryl-CoA dehydratase subunit BcrC/BadD/HgdB
MSAHWPRLATRFDLFGWYEALRNDPRPKAWCSAFAPAEILLAAGIVPIYPENHAALLGALSPDRDPDHPYSAAAIDQAVTAGHTAPPLCNYALADLGVLGGADSPIGALPGPDLVYVCDSQCRVVERWAIALRDHFHSQGREVPVQVLRAPRLRGRQRPDAAQCAAVDQQLREHLDDLTRRGLATFDPERLAAVTAESAASSALWSRALDANRDGAAVWCMTEAFAAMAPIVVARGFSAATDFYRELLLELAARPRPAVAPLRLLWDGIPIWPRKNWLADLLHAHGAIIAASTYTHAWSFAPHPEDAWTSLVARYAWNHMGLSSRHLGDWLLGLVRDYRIDAVVAHHNATCGIWNSHVQANARRCAAAGIPHLTLKADMVDPRHFDATAVGAALDRFLAGVPRHRSMNTLYSS